MKTSKSTDVTTPGPSEWFTGTVYLNPITDSTVGSHVNASTVHFAPGARTAWHSHPNGQTIFVTEGVARVQCRGGSTEEIPAGGRVFFEPGEYHWHGATPDRFMTHLSLLETDASGNSATWGAHVTDDEYGTR